jgi:hypothetical protein
MRRKEVNIYRKRYKRGARVKGEKRRGNKRSTEEVKMRGARGAQEIRGTENGWEAKRRRERRKQEGQMNKSTREKVKGK